MALSAARARALAPLLQPFADPGLWRARTAFDPLEFPSRYRDPRDVEVAALLASSLAYGRADLFRPRIAALLDGLGPRPGQAVAALDVPSAAALLRGFVYRFNVGADLAVLLLGAGAALRRHGSLEALFARELARTGELRGALQGFAAALEGLAPRPEIRRALGAPRAVHHLLPRGGGAAKRQLLFLRWLVRGPDGVDLGVWKALTPAQLVVPLDTHLARIARLLGLTRHRGLTWAAALDVTASLRRLDPDDPVRFDFALCHLGMSGACPARPVREHCARCPLRGACRVGRRLSPAAGVRVGARAAPPRGAGS